MNEKELSEKVKAGERSAFSLLYSLYAPDLFRLIGRYIIDNEKAKDLLQDCFLRIYDNINKYRYQGEGSLAAWLRRLCTNECLMFLRRESKNLVVPLDDEQVVACEVASPTEEQLETLPSEVLESFIKSLPDGYRTVFVLFVIEGKSHKEIAKLLGINEKSSSSQLTRAKRLLAKAINEWYNHNQ